MRQERINKAYSSLLKLKGYNLPVKKAYAIYKLASSVEEAYEFALNEERKYMADFNGTLNENGTITFPTPTECAAFRDKVEELCDIDADITVEPVTLTEADLGEQTITPLDIANLEGFVAFE